MVIVTEKREDPKAQFIAKNMKGACLNLAGRTPLSVLGAIIEALSVLITTDSGPAHIGYALGSPTVTLFASEKVTPFWPPTIGPFRPLTCLESITVDQVVQAAKEVLLAS